MSLNGNDKNRLLDFITKTNRHAWIGMSYSFNMDTIDMESCKNFRLSPELHQKYDVVWLYEKRLDHYHILSWKIIIDEHSGCLTRTGFLLSDFRKVKVLQFLC